MQSLLLKFASQLFSSLNEVLLKKKKKTLQTLLLILKTLSLPWRQKLFLNLLKNGSYHTVNNHLSPQEKVSKFRALFFCKKKQLQNLWDTSGFYQHSPSCYKITAKILAFCTPLPLVKIRSTASMTLSSSLCMSGVWLLCCDTLTMNYHPVNKLHEWCYPYTLTPHPLHILKQMLHQMLF